MLSEVFFKEIDDFDDYDYFFKDNYFLKIYYAMLLKNVRIYVVTNLNMKAKLRLY